MAFDSFIGNRKNIERLQVKLRQGRFPHGLLFSGPEGIGKRTCALMVAKALNCANAADGEFCGACSQCHKIDAGTHPDVIHIGLEEEASEIKIAQVREATRMLDFRPLEGRSKVFIIDPANLLNISSANALLKALEEPPDNSYFILITNNLHALLPTIRSRCQSYAFTPLSLDELRKYGTLQGSIDELTLRWSRGSIGTFQTLDAAALKLQREVILSFIETAVLSGQEEFRDLLSAAKEVAGTRQDFETHLELIGVVLTDLLYLKQGRSDSIINYDIRERLEKLVEQVTVETLIRLAEFLRLMELSLKTHVNRSMLTEVLALSGNLALSKILDDIPMRSR
ncbi:MAG TPA: DNA polymerase III subunit delta' [Terriglobia bacterium]|nr:DNA polymerase III subunit delta' [Terriglobia bacterium]